MSCKEYTIPVIPVVFILRSRYDDTDDYSSLHYFKTFDAAANAVYEDEAARPWDRSDDKPISAEWKPLTADWYRTEYGNEWIKEDFPKHHHSRYRNSRFSEYEIWRIESEDNQGEDA